MANPWKVLLKRNVLFSKVIRPKISKIAIIGRGVAGLQAARALQRIGKKVTIFEKNDDFGGVWHHNYDGATLQTEFELYQFPEYLHKQHIKLSKKPQCGIYDFPSVAQVKEYIQGYAKHFNLYDNARFNTRIVNISPQFDQSGDITSWEIKRYELEYI